MSSPGNPVRFTAALRANGRSDHSIALAFGVTDKTIAKAIRWLCA